MVSRKTPLIVCAGCGERHKKVPSTWNTSRFVPYCAPCWDAIECQWCHHHDPKGSEFRGRWQCGLCRNRQKTETTASVQEISHRIIIDEFNDEMGPSVSLSSRGSAQRLSSDPAPAAQEGQEEDAEEQEQWDAVAPLPDLQARSLVSVREKDVGHVVLLLDASGSMRTNDVKDGQGSTSRLEAAALCARDFIVAHARVHPNDIYSIVAFHEDCTCLCKAEVAADAQEVLEQAHVVCRNGTFYRPALTLAAEILDGRPGFQGHVVMLSDGRPADTKKSLEFFQDVFVSGRHASAHLHGIGFGSTVESFAPLQQLACISGGVFTLAGCNLRELCEAFTSVSSSITFIKDSSQSMTTAGRHREVRQVTFELPEVGVFGKKGVLRFTAIREIFRYDGADFVKQEFPVSAVERRMQPYMRGGMRLVYGFNDQKVAGKDGGWMVAKMSRFASPAFNTAEVVEAHARSTAVARHFSGLFNQKLQEAADAGNKNAMPSLIFVPCFVYKVQTASLEDAGAPAVFAAERYLPGAFLKYNSNNGYVNDANLRHHDVVQAFLHYSFVASEGALVVADLQGVARKGEVLLTDPQVLSVNGGGNGFGPGDLRARGAKACLASHRCGAACKLLGLKPISSVALSRLEAHSSSASHRRPRGGSSAASANSGASWYRIGTDDEGCSDGASQSGNDWERLSERNFEIPMSDGIRSSQGSSSSWAMLDM